MSSSRIRYTDKFKRDAVARVLAGHPPSYVAREIKISEGLLHRWVNAASPQATPKKRVRKSRVQATAPLVDEGGPLVEANPESVSLGRAEPRGVLDLHLQMQVQVNKLTVEGESLRLSLRRAEKEVARSRQELGYLRALVTHYMHTTSASGLMLNTELAP